MIKDELVKIFGFPMRPGKWQAYAESLNMKGEPTRANMTRLLFSVCEAIEKLESVEGIEYRGLPIDPKDTATSGKLFALNPETFIHPLLKFDCPNCDKSYKSRIALLGHSRAHKVKEKQVN